MNSCDLCLAWNDEFDVDFVELLDLHVVPGACRRWCRSRR
jgi:hypothetical protein